eukprot:1157824-Pelagomonas_calceolata.AAC.9
MEGCKVAACTLKCSPNKEQLQARCSHIARNSAEVQARHTARPFAAHQTVSMSIVSETQIDGRIGLKAVCPVPQRAENRDGYWGSRGDESESVQTLFETERAWSLRAREVELEHSKPLKDEDESTMDTPRNKLPTPLSYASRLNWGKNFYTASPASERLGVGHTF